MATQLAALTDPQFVVYVQKALSNSTDIDPLGESGGAALRAKKPNPKARTVVTWKCQKCAATRDRTGDFKNQSYALPTELSRPISYWYYIFYL
jgi:hypothetical protein